MAEKSNKIINQQKPVISNCYFYYTFKMFHSKFCIQSKKYSYLKLCGPIQRIALNPSMIYVVHICAENP